MKLVVMEWTVCCFPLVWSSKVSAVIVSLIRTCKSSSLDISISCGQGWLCSKRGGKEQEELGSELFSMPIVEWHGKDPEEIRPMVLE